MADPKAYCVKCRAKRGMKDGHEVAMKDGRSALTGACIKCGTKMFNILAKKIS